MPSLWANFLKLLTLFGTLMANSVYEIIVKLSGLNGTTTSLEQTERSVNLLNQAVGAVVPGLRSAGEAITGFADKARQANVEMEQGISNYAALTGQTMEAGREYAKSLDVVVAATRGQINQNDLLTASYDAASAGFTESADALGLLSAAGQLAIAGNSGLGDATDNLSSSQLALVATLKSYQGELSAYGDTSEQATIAAAKMNNVIKLGITDIGQLAKEWAEVAPSAKAAGMSMDDLGLSYARLTSNGIKTNIATTQLKAGLQSIAKGGGTDQAKKMVEELGLKFSSSALEAEGLIGVLESLEENGVTSLEKLLELTGTSEGAGFFAGLLSDMDTTREMLGTFKGELDDVGDLAAAKAAEGFGPMTAALNAFNTELARAGENAINFEKPLVEASTNVLRVFNALPGPLKSFISYGAQIRGVTLTATANIVQFAANVMMARMGMIQWVAQMKAAKAATAAQTVATGGLAGAKLKLAAATGKATGAMAAFNAKLILAAKFMAPLAATAVALAAAVGSVALAVGQYNNLKIQELEFQNQLDLAGSESMVRVAEKLVATMRKTGEAIPTAEFNQYIALMKEAGGESNAMGQHIDVLTRLQEQYTNKTGEAAKAAGKQATAQKQLGSVQAELVESTEDLEAAATAAAEAEQRRLELMAEATDTLSKQLDSAATAYATYSQQIDNATIDGTATIEQAFEARADALAKLSAANSRYYEQAMRSGRLDADTTAKLQADKLAKENDLNQKRLELQRDWAAESRRITEDFNTFELLQIEERAYREQWTEEQLAETLTAIRGEHLHRRKAAIEAELASVVVGSEKERKLYLELLHVRVDLAKQEGALVKAEKTQSSEDTAQELERIEREAKDARIKIWQDETADFKAGLEERLSAAEMTGKRLSAALSNQAATNNVKSESLGIFGGLSDTAASTAQKLLDIEKQITAERVKGKETGELNTAEIARLTDEQDKQLKIKKLVNSELNRSNKILRDQGIIVSGAVGSDQQAVSLAAQRLELEAKNIQIKLRMQTIETELNILAQDRLILEAQRLLQAEDISKAEQIALNAQIANAREQKLLLDEQLVAARELAGLEMTNKVSKERAALASQGVDPKSLGESLTIRDITQGTTEGFRPGVEELGRKHDAQIQATQAALDAAASSINQSATQSTQSANQALLQGITAAEQDATRQQVTALGQQTTQLQNGLNTLNGNIIQLPGRIAAAMPRPAPPARTK